MRIIVQDDDEAGFIAEVRACVFGIIRRYHAPELYLIKTDTWFGPNWVRFRGKAVGQLGIWSNEKTKNMTVPPFVPHRILWERRYVAPDYKQIAIQTIVHTKTPSVKARVRYLHDVAPGASLLWYTGASRKNKRAAIMAYLLVNGSYWPWYLGWEFRSTWKIVKTAGASLEEIAEIQKASEDSKPPA